MWSGLGSNEMVTTHPKPTPPSPRELLSLANYADKFLFVIGGLNPEDYALYASVDMYTIASSSWSQAPPLNEARRMHSSCVAGDTVCVFGGYNGKDFLNSIERIDAYKLTSGDLTTSWEMIELAIITPRILPLVAPFSVT